MSKAKPLPSSAGRWHVWIVALGGFVLLLSWGAVTLVDLLGLVRLEQQLTAVGRQPVLWATVLGEGGPVENTQWALLGAGAAGSAYLAGILRGRGQEGANRFWAIMSAALVLMLLEDAGNIRHHLGSYVNLLTGAEDGTHPAAVATERTVLLLIALVPVYALLYHRTLPWRSAPTRRLLIGGYVAYGTVATTNATRDFFGWYERAGDWVLTRVFAGRLGEISQSAQDRGLTTGHEFMDTVFEESLELVGATMLCAAVVAYASHIRTDPSLADGDPPVKTLSQQWRSRGPADQR